MQPIELVLDESATARVPASGIVTVSLGPLTQRQTWIVLSAAVKVSTNINEPVATLYLGTKATILGSTYTGSSDSTALQVTTRSANLFCEWVGADVGAIATLSLYGSLHIGR